MEVSIEPMNGIHPGAKHPTVGSFVRSSSECVHAGLTWIEGILSEDQFDMNANTGCVSPQ